MRWRSGRAAMLERFWQKVNKTSTCWLWTGFIHPSGYGRVMLTGAVRQAHRVAYEFVRGPIPEGLVLDHLCRVRNCVNPDHLEPVMQRINVLRGAGPGAKHALVTHCPKGHPYDTKNTYFAKRGRDCRTCHNERVSREYYAKKEARHAAM